MSMNTVPERLAALRAAMKANGVDVYLIPVGDPHSSEYLPDHYTSLTYFSGSPIRISWISVPAISFSACTK